MGHYAPGLSPSELERMTPEETRFVRKAVQAIVNDDEKIRLEHTKAIMRSNARRLL